jgi:hypothetical protein
VTGVAPVDESAAALAATLGELLADPGRLGVMGRAAAAWARARFDPDLYAAQVHSRLM